MSLLVKLKKVAERLPEGPTRLLTHVPFSWRLGRGYSRAKREIAIWPTLSTQQQRDYCFQRVRHIVDFAAAQIPFYRDFYRQRGFDPASLRGYDDIQRIPVITKDDLRQAAIEDRTCPHRGMFSINTGGTSGSPLLFYQDRGAFAREWAHQHHMWRTLGYRQTDDRLTFRGVNLGHRLTRYNVVHNEYIVNTYKPTDEVAPAIWGIARKRPIRFLFGYPSAIYTFACHCQEHDPALAQHLRRTLKGALFASEYPAPVYREKIEQVFGIRTLSWYGHSEMALLAYEANERYLFEPLHTYGHCETLPAEGGSQAHRLIGTGYYNTAHPFIRYDTGDLVQPVEMDHGLLRSFRVAEGRVGEFVTDADGHAISLTALIFGRHHRVFGKARFVQVRQDQPGHATLLVTLRDPDASAGINWADEFDFSNVHMRFTFETRTAPIRSAAGKTPLLVRADHHVETHVSPNA